MRQDPLVTGLYYHIYNRGVDKRDIFMNEADLKRFALSAQIFNTKKPVGSIKDYFYSQSDVRRPETPKNQEKLVSIVCYCFNPNHFHFILKQEIDGGISEYFKRLLGGYTKYFNLMHNRTGALFQGRYKSNLINDEGYLLRIRPYVHMNHLVHEIPATKKHLILSSEKEYNTTDYKIVSEEEARDLVSFYGDLSDFQNECLKEISIIREERGLTSLLEEDKLP